MTRSTRARARSDKGRAMRERRLRGEGRLRNAWWAIIAGPVLVVLMVLINLAIRTTPVHPTAAGPLPADVLAALQVPPSTLDSVGKGSGVTAPSPITGQPALTAGDKPL